MPNTFLLITLLCFLPPVPVASKNLLKHIHKDIHKILELLKLLGRIFFCLFVTHRLQLRVAGETGQTGGLAVQPVVGESKQDPGPVKEENAVKKRRLRPGSVTLTPARQNQVNEKFDTKSSISNFKQIYL